MKSILVTGAAGGIGSALCAAFVAAGYRVIASDREAPAGDGLGFAMDLGRLATDPHYRQERLAQLRELLPEGTLHALVNNAAHQVVRPFPELTVEDFRHTQDVNVTAPFLLMQALLPALQAAEGCVINVASIHARLTKPGFAAYATSKAALAGLTRALAVELGHAVRFNTILPAAIATPMLQAGFAEDTEGLDALAAHHPARRIGTPAEVAELAVFLASDRARFINGADIPIDGAIGARLHDPA